MRRVHLAIADPSSTVKVGICLVPLEVCDFGDFKVERNTNYFAEILAVKRLINPPWRGPFTFNNAIVYRWVDDGHTKGENDSRHYVTRIVFKNIKEVV